jgi:hypothetical protein
VKALMGLDGKVYNYVEMLAAVRKLGLQLSAAEVAMRAWKLFCDRVNK